MDVVEILRYIIGQLVEDPETITIEQDGEEVKVFVKKSDMGKVIGRQGRIAKAIRTVVRAVAVKENKKFNIEIQEVE